MCISSLSLALNTSFCVGCESLLWGIPGTIMAISKDRVKPSPQPDSWKLAEIFTTGIIFGSYLAMTTVIFFWAAYQTDFFPLRKLITTVNGNAIFDWAWRIQLSTQFKFSVFSLSCNFQRVFGVPSLQKTAHGSNLRKLASAVYLQVSITSQALIFVTRSRSWSFLERPGLLLVAAFVVAQLVSELRTPYLFSTSLFL